MVNDAPSSASINVLTDRIETKRPSTRDLRLENLQLRQRLNTVEDAAERHAVMLREADHRIKNSLQLVSSLMSLQARRETSEAARDALLLAAARVGSIGSIHDALQVSIGDGLIDLRFDNVTFLLNLVDSLAGDDRFIELRKRQPKFRRLAWMDEFNARRRVVARAYGEGLRHPEVHLMPAIGGPSRRLTWLGPDTLVRGWTPRHSCSTLDQQDAVRMEETNIRGHATALPRSPSQKVARP